MKLLVTILLAFFFSSSYAYTQDDHCIAVAVHREASKTIYKDKVAVYQVIVNRSQKLSKSFCEVLKEPRQFSFVKPSTKWIATKEQLKLLDKLKKEARIFGKDVLYFHSKTNDPAWARKMVRVITIGKHKFYRLKEN